MMNKKKLGIIGGMGAQAGAYFFKKIIDFSPATKDQEFLEIIFHNNSSVPDRTRAIVYNEASPLDGILNSIHLFNQNKVQVIVMGCVTAYHYYEQLCLHTNACILNPLHLVAESILKDHPSARKVGVLATTGTLRSGLFHRGLKACNVEVITLDPADQEALFMRAVYGENGFKSASASETANALMGQAIDKLIKNGAELIIGGCTEVSIARKPDNMKTPYLDVLDLFAEKTVDYCYRS